MKTIFSYDEQYLWTKGKGSLSKTAFRQLLHTKTKEAMETMRKNLMTHETSVVSLPFSSVKEIQSLAFHIQKTCTHLLVIATGGSSLGAQAIIHAIPGSTSKTKVLFLSNPDPDEYKRVTKELPWSTTGALVISKSGKTLEVLSLFLLVREQLQKTLGKQHASHLFVLTQFDENPLYLFAKKQGYTLLPHADIGGRFSVLSSVGLLPAAVSEVPIADLLKGAADLLKEYQKQGLSHVVSRFVTAQYLAYTLGKTEQILMPYCERLTLFTKWYRQLWAESLGKERQGRGVGPTPIDALGTVDQHSQIQLYNQGLKNKILTFIELAHFNEESLVLRKTAGLPDAFKEAASPLSLIMRISCHGTARASSKHGGPGGILSVPKLDAYHLGALFLFFELAVILHAELLQVNPYNQPGVEEGKKQIKKLLSSL